MSVEIRWVIEGHCNCGVIRAGTPFTCTHRIVCDWGEIEHTNPHPERGEVGHLMIAYTEWFEGLCAWGPALFRDGRVYRATVVDDRRFVHLEYQGQRWTWEMFDAHLADEPDLPLLLGRWPD